ncbi:MAG: hypothetical protein QOD99_135 [Chthoniobacter sp.]|nr:hypothetical protein [Chthoniobacter sp.]
MLNMMIASILRRQRLPEELIKRFIFDTGIRAKYIFLILQLCKRPPNIIHLNAINQLSERRNQFVHFKWTYYEEKKWHDQDKAYEHALSKIENVVRHLHYLEHRYIRYRLTKLPRKSRESMASV